MGFLTYCIVINAQS